MPARMVEVFLPSREEEKARELLQQKDTCECLGIWSHKLDRDQSLVQFLINAEDIDRAIDLLQTNFSGIDGFRVVLLPVEATLPHPETKQEAEKAQPQQPEKQEKKPEQTIGRIGREELYSKVSEEVVVSTSYEILVILSAIVAAVGLMRNQVAVVIGAMVIAPLLGPNVALSLATTLGDLPLVRRALRAMAVGLATTFLAAALMGYSMTVNIASPQIASRTQAQLSDIALALAAGGAGALSFTMGLSTALVGVMVAVALLPPLVVFGMLVGAQHWPEARGALLLTLVNLICINLAGIVTFIAQGVRPGMWWEMSRAKRATRWAILIWALLLVALGVAIVLTRAH
jgi:uncharacterized hydrophobic protein (TIGR00341 family)